MIDHSGANEGYLLGTDQYPVPTYNAFVRNVVAFFLASYRVFKCIEPLSFDSPVETDVVIRFPTYIYIFIYY